ncbi:MAG: hypothetical protein A3B44_00300 [Candidatus Levybacteria bacterium RIFCSPLOWO2_01_FULL_38_21]|nr:MAG: hypothetical protein A3B44_00300 [Candidatus Levybacteria bacterium RIFCSPLOWO2_01_FULL_38_21]
MARSLNRAQIIGNLTRDPELRYTPNGTAVCSFSVATNRRWTTETGEKRDEADFHRVVAWNKLAEICSQFLVKGRKVYLEGRLSTRSWNAQDGTQRSTTEIIISDMILLDSRRPEEEKMEEKPEEVAEETSGKKLKGKSTPPKAGPKGKKEPGSQEVPEEAPNEEIAPDDIPF